MPAAQKLREPSPGPKGAPRMTLRQRYPLRYRKIIKKNLGSVILIVAFWLLGAFLILKFLEFQHTEPGDMFSSGHRIWFWWVVLLLVTFAWRVGYSFFYFLTYFYDIDEKNVVIRKGVIARTEVTLPFSKVTDVFVDQDVLDFVFGLCDLHISTPTVESGAFAHIDGLDRKSAAAIRALVLEKIHIHNEKR